MSINHRKNTTTNYIIKNLKPPETMSNPYYNYYCNSNSRNCRSGCCTVYGSCATSSSTCYYLYNDYSSSKYSYSNDSISMIAFKAAAPIWGAYLGYFLLFVIGIVVFYCIRKKWVNAVNLLDTEKNINTAYNGSPLPPVTSGIRPNQVAATHYGQPFGQGHYAQVNPQMQTTFTNLKANNASLSLNDTSLNTNSRTNNQLQMVSRGEIELADELVATKNI